MGQKLYIHNPVNDVERDYAADGAGPVLAGYFDLADEGAQVAAARCLGDVDRRSGRQMRDMDDEDSAWLMDQVGETGPTTEGNAASRLLICAAYEEGYEGESAGDQAMAADLSAITLPAGIHAEIHARTDAVTQGRVERGVVWADRAYLNCPRCGETAGTEPGCPVTINEGDGRGAQFEEWSQQHGCGEWLPVLWDECGTSESEILEAATALAERRRGALATSRDNLAAALRDNLAAALASASGPAREDRGGITTGSDAEPGIFFDESGCGEWIAWDYDPAGNGEFVTVYASDLAA